MKRRYEVIAVPITLLLFQASSAWSVPPVTVESKCSSGGSYVEGGTGWGNSSSKSNRTPCSNGSRSTKNAAAYADFIPPIATEGNYDVFVTWGPTTSSNNGPNAENVQVSIIDRDGTQNFIMNMRGHSGCTGINSDQLIYVGRGYFVPGQGHKLRIANTGTGQCFNGVSKRYVSADAAVFEFSTPVPVEPQSWSRIKARYTQ